MDAGHASASPQLLLRPPVRLPQAAHSFTQLSQHERNASLSEPLSQARALADRYTYRVSDAKVTELVLSDAGIAERIRMMRDRRGLTDAELAEVTGRTPGGFSVYLATMSTSNRPTKPTAEFVWRAALALGVRFEWLLTGEGPVDDDLPPDPEHPARRQASISALLLGLPREAIEQVRLQEPSRTLSAMEWFRLIELTAATSNLGK